ncbi:hypothetical protein KC19_VG110600 [Ceratodon purpureus]|uniref:Uncharacterized protein n=1 Tax=Ceratodon purpureus TaxID=3225 RepID=A0A8T0HP63_CERPU|nr:hypothetical protein KC19_VG110600 [Ceratodon purpureus]
MLLSLHYDLLKFTCNMHVESITKLHKLSKTPSNRFALFSRTSSVISRTCYVDECNAYEELCFVPILLPGHLPIPCHERFHPYSTLVRRSGVGTSFPLRRRAVIHSRFQLRIQRIPEKTRTQYVLLQPPTAGDVHLHALLPHPHPPIAGDLHHRVWHCKGWHG